ncbi:MAG: ankyrin repeat domain-containing protein [Rhabdochlamydiaceae bacterium]
MKRFSWHLFLILSVLIMTPAYTEEKNQRRALTNAIIKGDLRIVQSIMESEKVGIEEVSENDHEGITPLVEAAVHGKIPIIKYLIEKGASVNGLAGKKSTPLTKLIQSGSSKLSCQQLIELTRFFIDSGADINCAGEGGYTPLMNACKYTRCIDLMDMLLAQGALIDVKASDENTAFSLAIRYTNVNAFRFLLNRGADATMDCKGLSPLGVAAAEGNVAMAKLIIEELKADVNKYDSLGGTPIFWAALNGCSAMIAFLVERGADINAKTNQMINVEKQPKSYLSRIKSFATFPKNSTPLTFAKWFEMISAANLICDLGGIEFEKVDVKEWTATYMTDEIVTSSP